MYENIQLKHRVDRLEKDIKKLRRDLSDKGSIPDLKMQEGNEIQLTESEMKREDLASMQKTYDHQSKKAEKVEKAGKKQFYAT